MINWGRHSRPRHMKTTPAWKTRYAGVCLLCLYPKTAKLFQWFPKERQTEPKHWFSALSFTSLRTSSVVPETPQGSKRMMLDEPDQTTWPTTWSNIMLLHSWRRTQFFFSFVQFEIQKTKTWNLEYSTVNKCQFHLSIMQLILPSVSMSHGLRIQDFFCHHIWAYWSLNTFWQSSLFPFTQSFVPEGRGRIFLTNSGKPGHLEG